MYLDIHYYSNSTFLSAYTAFFFRKLVHFLRLLLFRFYLFIFRESRKEKERGRQTLMCKRNFNGLPSTRGPDHNPGMCPDWELNWQASGLHVGV